MRLTDASPPLSKPRGALDGRGYRATLNDGRQVWLDGERVSDVSRHQAFRGGVDELSRLFDLQHDPETRDLLTVESPITGNRISWAYHLPRTLEDLKAKRRNAEFWMRQTWGQHGRSPAFMATVAVGLHDFHGHLDGNRPGFGQNAVDYHRYCSENDLVLTHALGDPQIDRSASPAEHPDYALRIIEENERGVIVRGAKQLTTLAPFAHEVLVYLSASFADRDAEQFVIWFATPINTHGLKILCREPLGVPVSSHTHPLGERFDEQDAMLFFDDVLVPWNRVFLMHDAALARQGLTRINAWSQYVGQVRYQERLRTLLGVATLVAESIGVNGFRNVQEDLGELAGYVDLLGYFLDAGESRAHETDGGLFAPGDTAASAVWSAQISGRTVEILRRIASSGILMQPSEKDLLSDELRPYLDRYMKGRTMSVDQKSRLFRLAWDLAGDGFGQRQDLYEFVHRGDLTRNRINLFRRHDQTDVLDRIRTLISEPPQSR